MNTKRLLIIEDEIIIGLAFSKYLDSKGYSCDLALDYKQAMNCFKQNNYDIALIDIKLKGSKSGLDIAEIIHTTIGIPFVFITSYMDVDTLNRAKMYKPKGYLTKPINKDSLYTTLEMIELNSTESDQYLIVKDGKDVLRIKKAEIQFIKSNHVYVSIETKSQDKPYLIRNSLQNILNLLGDPQFVQVHRCYIVNTDNISKINRTELFINHHRIPIGKTRQKDFAKRFLSTP